jgi:uncharacterized protein YggE
VKGRLTVKKIWIYLGLGLALVLAVVGLAACTSGTTTVNTSPQQEGIWVTGQGKVTVVPDIATLQLGVEAQAATVAEAQTQASQAMNQVMAVLTENGVASKDIQTQYFNITKVTRWDDKNQQEVVIGYRVTNVVTAKIRTIDETGAIIDAVAAAGGDFTRIDSISFSVDDPTTYYEQAREKAMADAKAKAEQLARLGNVTLGKPTYISESSYFPFPTPIRLGDKAVSSAETPISPGEMDVTISVQVVYAILK